MIRIGTDTMAEQQDLKRNLIYQFLYQALILAAPLIVSPYLTRCMGDTALGIYTYVNSIACYFVVFANLGISRHGQRVIAQHKSDEIQLRKCFWSLYTLHAVLSLAAVAAYAVIFGLFYTGSHKSVAMISTLYVVSALFDVTWLFYGLEKVKTVVVKNAAVRIIECAAIFCCVHSPDDLWVYTLIVSAGVLAGQLAMIPQAIAVVKPISFRFADIKCHIKPLVVFSVVVIAVTLYTVFDKTLLGLMTTKENVAYYEYANKIVGIPRSFTTVIGTVLFPRACRLAAGGDIKGQKKYLDLSVSLVYFVGFAALFGLAAVSDLFARVYFGQAFAVSGGIMGAMCALPLIVGLGDVLRTQYLIPNHKDQAFFLCVISNAVVNLVLSCWLIPVLGVYGAVVGTYCAELWGLLCQMILCRRFVSISRLLRSALPFCVSGILMYGAVGLVSRISGGGPGSLLLQIGAGGTVYCALLLAYFWLKNRKGLLN